MPLKETATSPPKTSKRKDSVAELLLMKHLDELGFAYEREVKFHHLRKWRWDFTLPEHRIAIEVDGYFQGKHGAGWGTSDNDKQNHGVMLGWRVLRFSTKAVLRGHAKAFLAAQAELFGRQP